MDALCLPACSFVGRKIRTVRLSYRHRSHSDWCGFLLNPTTVEVLFSDGQRIRLFMGENIVRLFQDPNGGIIRDPQASPEAQILTDSPRNSPEN